MIKDIISLYNNDYHLRNMTWVTEKTLHRIKTNRTNPTKTTLNKLEKYFKHTRDMIDLYFENKEMKKSIKKSCNHDNDS